ncbi:MAG TPA: metalloregulator ArsR/SmtB family transcription factor [Steroidobacteraceae bacterium]|jgi:DNA-binding transcriptional ArsR family regulator|nr:metalloregulator ArsR/SmtB family transcription factor [Steroidobacteraceae bacterium]
MTRFVHPAKEDITLGGILGALSDPMRLKILRKLLQRRDGQLSCSGAAPCAEMAKSTLSHHFRVLREAGLIRTTKQGVENLNGVRWDEVNERFPGLLKAILKFSA